VSSCTLTLKITALARGASVSAGPFVLPTVLQLQQYFVRVHRRGQVS
jgi:hypothetical protein